MGFSQTLLTHPIFAAGILTLKSVSVVVVLSSSLKINFFVIEKTGQVVGLAKTAKIHYCSKVSYHPFTRLSSLKTIHSSVESRLSSREEKIKKL